MFSDKVAIPYGVFMSSNESNNPSIDNLIGTYHELDTLGLMNEDLQKGSEILDVVRKFNPMFKDEAWVLNNYLPFDSCQSALFLAEKGKLDKANLALIEGVTDGIDKFMLHLAGAPAFNDRKAILENARELYLQGNHSAAVLLLLIALDGISNDIANLGIFAQNSDLGAWDSITQYEETFTYIQENFLTKSRTKTNLEEIYLPYRNGILHGRDVNFSNSHVSAKCWNILFTLRTWYMDKKDEPYKKKQLIKKANLKNKNEIYDHYLNRFQERLNKSGPTEDFGVLDIVTTFFNSWQHQQWAKIVPLMYHLVGKHKGKAAREVKENYSKFELKDYRIIGFSNENPSSASVQSILSVLTHGELKKHTINLRINYSCDELLAIPIGHPNGTWGIVQNSLSEILFSGRR